MTGDEENGQRDEKQPKGCTPKNLAATTLGRNKNAIKKYAG
jgi:hypothetical protein